MNTYRITLRGQVDVDDLNHASPHQMTPDQIQAASTIVTVYTDQSGLLGLIRHLHNLGLEISSITSQSERKEE